jgi:hypothetical protein
MQAPGSAGGPPRERPVRRRSRRPLLGTIQLAAGYNVIAPLWPARAH